MLDPLRLRPRHLIPLTIGAAAALYLLMVPSQTAQVGRTLAVTLAAVVGVLFLLHCMLALRLQHTVAFLVGLQLGYYALVLMRSTASPLLGLGPAQYAQGLAVLLPVGLVVAYLFGPSPPLAPRSFLRVAAIVALPLLWALAVRRFPGAVAGLLRPPVALGCLPLATAPTTTLPPVLTMAAVLLLVGLGVLLLRPRRPRTLYDLCLAATLVPAYILLGQTIRGASAAQSPRIPVTFACLFLVLLYGLYRLFWERAFLDELTGLGNRRSLEERLRFLGGRFTLAIIDIDHFKAINDTYGHAEGDNILRWVAGQIRRDLGSRAYRYGGEEFVVVLPDLDLPTAAAALERLRQRLAGSEFFVRSAVERRRSRPGANGGRKGKKRRSSPDRRRQSPGGSSSGRPGKDPGRRAAPRGRGRIHVTVSVGLAGAARKSRRPQEVLRRADQALYRAKHEGRNRLVVAGGSEP